MFTGLTTEDPGQCVDGEVDTGTSYSVPTTTYICCWSLIPQTLMCRRQSLFPGRFSGDVVFGDVWLTCWTNTASGSCWPYRRGWFVCNRQTPVVSWCQLGPSGMVLRIGTVSQVLVLAIVRWQLGWLRYWCSSLVLIIVLNPPLHQIFSLPQNPVDTHLQTNANQNLSLQKY